MDRTRVLPALRRVLRALRGLPHHIGRRGAYLAFLVLLDVTVGYALMQPLPLGLDSRPFYAPFLAIMPLSWWAWWWVSTGAAAAVAVLWHRLRPPVFAAAAALKTGWAIGYFVGWAEGLPAFSRGYQSAAIYCAFGLVTLVVAGWRENGT